MEMGIQTSFLVSRAQTAAALGVWVMTTRSEKSRQTDFRGSTAFPWNLRFISVLIFPSNRPTFGSTDNQPKGVASTDDGTVFVVTAKGVEVYLGGNVGKKVADLQLNANLNCIAVHGKTVAVGGEVSLSSLFAITLSSIPPAYYLPSS
jgi:hypothetical protein